jgi:hypothetical protein
MDGPQDLSIADEANDVSRRIWEGLGGTTLLMSSLYWTRPVRPIAHGLSALQARRTLRPLATALRSIAGPSDFLATRLPPSHFYVRQPRVYGETLQSGTVIGNIHEFSGAGALRVDYDHRTFEWLLDRISHIDPSGRVLAVVVRNEQQQIQGWYVCHFGSSRVMDLLQLTAKPESIDHVLDHLIYQSWQDGAIAVTGRMEPRFVQALSDKYCFFHRRGPWMLIKTRHPDLLRSFLSGAACFSRLDGERALRMC